MPRSAKYSSYRASALCSLQSSAPSRSVTHNSCRSSPRWTSLANGSASNSSLLMMRRASEGGGSDVIALPSHRRFGSRVVPEVGVIEHQLDEVAERQVTIFQRLTEHVQHRSRVAHRRNRTPPETVIFARGTLVAKRKANTR